MKRIVTLAVGGLLFLIGLLGVWSTVALVEMVATHVLVVAAAMFAVMIAAGGGLVIRAFGVAT